MQRSDRDNSSYNFSEMFSCSGRTNYSASISDGIFHLWFSIPYDKNIPWPKTRIIFADSFRNPQQSVYVPYNRPMTNVFASQYANSSHSPAWPPSTHHLPSETHQASSNSLTNSFYAAKNPMLWSNAAFQSTVPYGEYRNWLLLE